MTREEFALFLITFAATALAAIAVGVGAWRRQDRALARLASLAALAESTVLDDRARERFTTRLRNEANQVLAEDLFRRALRVQQSIYSVLGAGALALFWAGANHHGWAKAILFISAAGCFFVGFAVTTVPPQHWRVPAPLDTQGGPAVPAWMRSPQSERAVKVLDLKEGAVVLVYGCRRGQDLTAIREAVGETGTVIGIVRRQEELRYAEIVVLNSGWSNVDVVLGDITNVKDNKFDAVVALNGFERRDDLEPAVEGLHRVVRPGGSLMILTRRKRRAKNSTTPDALGLLVLGHFANVEVSEWSGGGVQICAKKPPP
jgi:hypothetical protein